MKPRCAILLLSLLLPSTAFADRVFYDGFEYADITVNGYRNGAVSVTLAGSDKLFELKKVEWIALDATPKMYAAERIRTTNAKAAAAFYRDAIRTLNDPELKRLAELRAIPATDTDGKFLEALTYFLDLYQAIPSDAIWQRRPTHLPNATSTLLTDAAALIASRLKSFSSDDAKKNLKTLQLELYTKGGDLRADALARELSGGGGGGTEAAEKPKEPPTESALVEPIENALNEKKWDDAIKAADELLAANHITDALSIKLYQLKARAWEAKGNIDESIATLLRIPAYYPESAEAPAALLIAADDQKKQDHPAEAAALYREIVAKYPHSPAAIRAAGEK